MLYRMETYQLILTILSPTKIDEFIQYNVFTGLLAVGIAQRLPSHSRHYVNECLNELVTQQFLRYSNKFTGPYRYRIALRGSRYLVS